MKTLKFSVGEHYPDAQSLFERIAKTGLKEEIHFTTETIPWQIMWSLLQRRFAYTRRFDVSEVGSTWVGSYAAMGALVEFGEDDITALGGADRFVPSAWKSTSLLNDSRILSIPWMMDTRVIYYWRDILQTVGVDEAHLGSTHL